MDRAAAPYACINKAKSNESADRDLPRRANESEGAEELPTKPKSERNFSVTRRRNEKQRSRTVFESGDFGKVFL